MKKLDLKEFIMGRLKLMDESFVHDIEENIRKEIAPFATSEVKTEITDEQVIISVNLKRCL